MISEYVEIYPRLVEYANAIPNTGACAWASYDCNF